MGSAISFGPMKCRLCQDEMELRDSHIVPAFFRDDSGSLFPTGGSGKPQPFTQITHTHPGKRFASKQHGYWEKRLGMIERLLCHDCEQKFSGWEDYAKRFFYGGSKPLRIQLPPSQEVFIADYSKMKLFQLSLLWRASQAKGELYASVKLSDQDNERLRQMLLNGDPGESHEYCCGMSRLVVSSKIQESLDSHGIAIETGSFAPVSHHHGMWDTHMFIMGGLGWMFCVCASGIPKIMLHTYIKENGSFFLSRFPADSFLLNYFQKVVQAGNVTKEDAEESMRTRINIKSAN